MEGGVGIEIAAEPARCAMADGLLCDIALRCLPDVHR
jgi:hypothetical protein